MDPERARRFTWEADDIKILSVGPGGDPSLIEEVVEPVVIADGAVCVCGHGHESHDFRRSARRCQEPACPCACWLETKP